MSDPVAVPGPSLGEARGQGEARRVVVETRHGVLESVQSLLYIIVVAIFIITMTAQPFRIPSASMEPTLLVGDFLLVDKQGIGFDGQKGVWPPEKIGRGEIIVFHYPIDPSIHLIKRVVGLPGDRLKLRDGRVYINGVALSEPYAVYRPSAPDAFRDSFPRLESADPEVDSRWWVRMHNLVEGGELLIPSGDYFVLGDNRNDSEDSRYWGFVPRSAIVGKPFLIYFSLRERDSVDGGLNLKDDAGERRTGVMDAVLGMARWGRTMSVVR
jgi:signal peptidase I